MQQDNKDARALLKELEDMNIQLEKISGQSANTLAGNLKARFSSPEGWIELGNDLGGLASGVSGAHA